MRLLKLVPPETKIDFIGKRFIAFALTLLLSVIAIWSLFDKGLNMGIDFRGGILIEASQFDAEGNPAPVDVAALRSALSVLPLGEVSLQTFGDPNTILLRVQQQAGGDDANAKAVETIKGVLGNAWQYNRSESVGPTIGNELLKGSFWATLLALAGITLYVIFRFEWQFGLAALVSTFHDVFVSLGLIAFLGLEFNLTTVAALLLLVGFSVNDTVIIFDRIREMLRRYKKADFSEIINLSVNATLSRTLLTSGLTLLAILPMLFFGGETLFAFTLVITWGIFIGTFSSIYVAAALMLYLPPVRMGKVEQQAPQATE